MSLRRERSATTVFLRKTEVREKPEKLGGIYGPARDVKGFQFEHDGEQMQLYIRPLVESIFGPREPDEICASPPYQRIDLEGP